MGINAKHRCGLTRGLLILAVLTGAILPSCGGGDATNLIVVERGNLPIVYYRLMINAGSAYDPEGKPGLAYFTAQLLDNGSESFTRNQIEEELDQIGAELSISVDKEVVVISGRTLAENSGRFYAILREVLLSPEFPDEEIKLQSARQLDRISQIREDDAQLSLGVFENTVFAGHRYGHLVEGTETAVREFTRQDVLDFYRSHYLRGNILAGIGGAAADSLIDRLRQDIDDLPAGRIVRSPVPVTVPKTAKVILVEKENRTQSHLRVGHALEDNRTSPQYYPMRLLSCYLGEHRQMFGRLFQTVRSERGLAYGAYAYHEFFRPAGWSKSPDNGIVRHDQYFHMWTYPKEVNFEFCIKLMLTEMTRLITTPLPAIEIDRVKGYVANSAPFLVETAAQELGMRMDAAWYGQRDFVDRFRKQISSTPRGELQTVALDNLMPRRVLMVAVVSNAEVAKQELLSPDSKLELPSGSDEGALKEVNDQIRRYDLKLVPDDIEIVRAAAVFK